MISVSKCPICNGEKFIKFGQATDFTVSHETFQLMKCTECDLVLTSPRPSDINLSKYYESPDYISHVAVAKNTFDKLYSVAREITLQWKLTLVKKFSPVGGSKAKVLDYGCGTGYFLKKLGKAGYKVTGIEPSEVARHAAIKVTGNPIHKSLEEVNGSFDVITLWHVLEHVPDLNETLGLLKSKITADGTIMIAVPNYKSEDANIYQMNWAGFDVPRHLWHFEQKTMEKFLANHNLKIIAQIPMKMDAIYVSMLSEKYRKGKQSLATLMLGFLTGLKANLSAKGKNYSSIIYVAKQE